MSSFHPEKLSVNMVPPANSTEPIEGRKYTLTHSDITGELFLDVGYVYNYEAIDEEMRDEVLAEWQRNNLGQFRLVGRAYVDGGEFSEEVSRVRFTIFQKEMMTALKGMVYGDRAFFANHPSLLDAPIYIHYDSVYPQFRQTVYYGTPRQILMQINMRTFNYWK
ncbi:staygreen family protein [Alkalihalobacterium chitinilyticum]|uniref:Staygreen family protein n=1 Tax=Alkalihalobacterium chitinilyticum TaxID=2980103 RepID=A0ABT5VIY8_9BACI|nr:staygreen family protein [Alkalihalobacterium chitinilyticum]MDE5415141.1 staygreen family protein [Alkalihalobacterium chitinilyticum]